MATAPKQPRKKDLTGELEKKLADIGEKEQEVAATALAKELGLPYSDLKALPIDPEALAILEEDRARGAQAAPVQVRGSTVIVVVTDPRTPAAKEAIADLQKRFTEVRVIIISPVSLEKVLKRYEQIRPAEVFEVGAIEVDEATVADAQKNIQSVSDLKQQVGSVSVTKLFEILIAGALKTRASDIHFEPEAGGTTRLRYRLDGLLHDVTTVDGERYRRLLNRLKVLSKMKLNITKAPQDGRFTIRESGVSIEVRVSILPSEYGESIVMRLLDPRGIKAKLEDLGMRTDILDQVKELLERPNGTLLTTGPTGSGKTTTLYAFINYLNTPDMKIITVEDPIEYHLAGISQTQVEPSKGYTFATGLRAIVRQDPDIILIGEIRDLETAEIALNAALTGHMVLSTIHTNDAAGTVPRLTDIGVKAETIAPALTMAMGQRLLRRLCPSCKKPLPMDAKDLEKLRESMTPVKERFSLNLDDIATFGPGGCDDCNGIGYKGRIGVYEVFEVTPEMERLILKTPAVSDIRDLAIQQGMATMLQDGYLKLLDGITSLEEVRRVLG
ncbi:MAG TPA: GspE/PulE family protein [Candidatus Paceibacterota bacterium]|nr:GspE/PulE family protein [Candidatus Paceibacterota bacterium]